MKFKASGGGDFQIAPAGNHLAVCNAIIDLGIQPGSGQYPDPKHKIYVRFELPSERVKFTRDGAEVEGPMSVGKEFTASMSEKANLRKFLESWRGVTFTDAQAEDFDLANILGKPCLLNIGHKQGREKTYANIVTATPLLKGMTPPTAENPLLFYDLTKPDAAVFAKLPQWLQKRISERIQPEQHEKDPGYSVEDETVELNDDIPF